MLHADAPSPKTKVQQESDKAGGCTLRKPYSVRATKAMGAVEMKQPAMGMKEQMNTNSDSSPSPGMASVHMPAAVKAVFTSAMRACAQVAAHSPGHTKYSRIPKNKGFAACLA